MSTFTISQGAGQKLEFAFQRNDADAVELEWLSAGENLKLVRQIALGDVELVFKTKSTPASKPVSRILKLGATLIPATFIGQGWKEVTEDTDPRAEALTELDLDKVSFVTTLKNGESSITGEERLKRLKASGQVRLGGKAFMACWNNRHLLPESWKKDESGNIRVITFDGLTLQGSSGGRCVLSLYWHGSEWNWYYNWLDNDFAAHRQSAVLES